MKTEIEETETGAAVQPMITIITPPSWADCEGFAVAACSAGIIGFKPGQEIAAAMCYQAAVMEGMPIRSLIDDEINWPYYRGELATADLTFVPAAEPVQPVVPVTEPEVVAEAAPVVAEVQPVELPVAEVAPVVQPVTEVAPVQPVTAPAAEVAPVAPVTVAPVIQPVAAPVVVDPVASLLNPLGDDAVPKLSTPEQRAALATAAQQMAGRGTPEQILVAYAAQQNLEAPERLTEEFVVGTTAKINAKLAERVA